MSELVDYLNRAAPAGSMRYFALLYAPAEHRQLLTSLFVIESEIRDSATQVAHEVSHTRLQWWRGEIDRLINRNAQHPATRALQMALPGADFSILHELLAAADMELVRMTYNTSAELNGYLERSGGAIFEVAATGEARVQARKIGGLIRRAESLRDFMMDTKAGRLYWPLDELESQGIPPERASDPEHREKLRTLLATETSRLTDALANTLATAFAAPTISSDYPLARPLAVLATLHARLLRRIAKADHNVFTSRHELGAIEKVWTAWRAARRH